MKRLFLGALCFLAGGPVFAQMRESGVAPETPRLVVLLVVDQLAASHFEQIQKQSKGAFRRLVSEGFRFHAVKYEAAPSQTAPGHATLGTGAYPEIHGIVANEWYESSEKRVVYVCDDPKHQTLGREPQAGDATSPWRMKASGLGDAFKATHAGSKVVAIAGKDRSAMLLVGGAADVALWVDYRRPVFTSSTAYAAQLPSWVAPTNERLRATFRSGYRWEKPASLPAPKEGQAVFGRDVLGFGKSFPHVVPDGLTAAQQSNLLLLSPLADDAVVELATAALMGEALGQDDVPDLLALSFSGFDRAIHVFGPQSPELMDVTARLDASLASFLATLDAKVGRGKYVLALTADHGGMDIPELLQARKLDAGRVDSDALMRALEVAVTKPVRGTKPFVGFVGAGVYAAEKQREALFAQFANLRVAGLGQPGVLDVLSRRELGTIGAGPWAALYARGAFGDRTPDFIVVTKPYWIIGPKDAADHGSAHAYDRTVPLLLLGAGVRHGETIHAELIDVAPTLTFLAGVAPPSGSQGRVLQEALSRFSP